MAASWTWEVALKLERDRQVRDLDCQCDKTWLLTREVREREAKRTPRFWGWTVEVDDSQFPVWETKGRIGFWREDFSSVFDMLGLEVAVLVQVLVRLLPGPSRSSFSVNRVIFLPATDEALHWENKECGLECARGTNLK